MQVTTYEGFVENGQIRLKTKVNLPEKAKVYVVIPELETETQKSVRIFSPRLVNKNQVADFKKEIIEEVSDADV